MAIQLTAEEEAHVLRLREIRNQHKWLVQGVFLAAEHLEQLGREAAGGDGEATNPATGKRWGEPYFAHGQLLRHYGAKLAATPATPTISGPQRSEAALSAHDENPQRSEAET